MKKRTRWLIAGAATAAAALLINPRLTNPPVASGGDLLATNPPPAEVAVTLKAACYDCHSYETHWPWYSHVAPASWWLVDHVNEGRSKLNFSSWPHNDAALAAKKMSKIREEITSGDMPLTSYKLGHPEARLTAAQRAQLARWAQGEKSP